MSNINWKQVGVAFFSMLTILAALPYSLGDLAAIIPPAMKQYVVVVGLVASVALRVWNAAAQPPPSD